MWMLSLVTLPQWEKKGLLHTVNNLEPQVLGFGRASHSHQQPPFKSCTLLLSTSIYIPIGYHLLFVQHQIPLVHDWQLRRCITTSTPSCVPKHSDEMWYPLVCVTTILSRREAECVFLCGCQQITILMFMFLFTLRSTQTCLRMFEVKSATKHLHKTSTRNSSKCNFKQLCR